LWPSKVLIQRPLLGALLGCTTLGVASSHILIVLSKLPDTRCLLFGAKATEYTMSLCPSGPSRRSRRYPVKVSQTRTHLSRHPAATSLVSGEMTTEVIPVSILRVRTFWPASISQRRTVLSLLPEAIVRPSRAKSKE
jgi:hypothetical protein